MPEPGLIQQQRSILRAFRQATAGRAQAEADAEARLKAGRGAADAALNQTRQKADAGLAEARKALETARSSLAEAGLGGLAEGALPAPSAAAPGADPEKELARQVSTAVAVPALLAADITALQQWQESQRRRRRLLLGVVVGAVVVIAIASYSGLRAQQTARQMAEQARLRQTAEAEQARLATEGNRLALAALAAGPVTVPAGEFLMGSTDADGMADSDEKPQHKVYLDAFLIDRTEVTNAMYAKCVQAGACQAPWSAGSNKRENYYGNPQYDNYPVINVSWTDADTYCRWAGGRLPTEAEWEKAARGTDGRIYPWGNDPPDAQKANYYDSKVGDTTAVGAYPAGASPYGALDMAGNVWEWVADRYGDTYYASSPDRNPTGPSSGDTRVLRGGSWLYYQGGRPLGLPPQVLPGLQVQQQRLPLRPLIMMLVFWILGSWISGAERAVSGFGERIERISRRRTPFNLLSKSVDSAFS